MFAALACKTISIEDLRRRRCLALTLVEFVIVLGLSALVATVLLSISLTTGRSFAEMVNYVDMNHDNRVALDYLTRELRQVSFLSEFETNRLTFIDNDGQPLSYSYSAGDRALVRTKGGQSSLVVQNCDWLNFQIYQRVPLAGTFDLIPTTEVTNCKVVGVIWGCSRKIFGIRANTEDAQAANIVIRNKQVE